MAEHPALVDYESGEIQFCIISAYLQLRKSHSDRIYEAIRFKNRLLRILEEYYDKRSKCNFLGVSHVGDLLLSLHQLLVDMDNQNLHISNSVF